MAPAWPPLPTFFMSAISESMCDRYSSGSGSGHVPSPARSDAARTRPMSASSEPNSPAIDMPERHHARAGERGQVDDGVGLELRRQRQAVGEHEPALGVGVEHLDGPAVADGEHVAGLGGPAPGHVLGRGRDGRHPHPHPELAARRHRGQHRGGPAHVGLHGDHAVGGLERQPTGVEGDALAHEHHVRHPAVDGRRGRRARRRSCSSRGGSAEPRATPSSPPSRSSAMRCSSQTSTVTPGRPAACSCGRPRPKRVGVIELGGSLTRSRARHTASADGDAPPGPLGQRAGVEAGPGHDEPLDPAPARRRSCATTNRYAAEHRSFDDGLHRAAAAVPASSATDAGSTSTAAPDFPPARTRAARGAPHGVVRRLAPASVPQPTNTTAGASAPSDPWALGSPTTTMVWPTLPLNPRWRARASSSAVSTAGSTDTDDHGRRDTRRHRRARRRSRARGRPPPPPAHRRRRPRRRDRRRPPTPPRAARNG